MNKPTQTLLLVAGLLVFGCDDDEHAPGTGVKLDYYIESYQLEDLDFASSLKVTYEYNQSGKLAKYTVLSYNPDSDGTEEQRYFTFSYSGDRVAEIKGFLPTADDPYIEYAYEYVGNGKVSKITQKDYSIGINSTATFTYPENGKVKVSYVFTNGGSFEYEFDNTTGNVLTDKTTRGAQLCSNGEYTYDTHKNPFNTFGYTDFLLTNLSVNNKLSESVNYVSCAFPSVIPKSYSYEYNHAGYPTKATTHYQSGGPLIQSKKEFFYR